MKNHQAPVPRALSDGSSILVHSIFPTMQGEGPFAGSPAVFIRLAGCNLQCPGCDTEYTDGARLMTVEEIVEALPHKDRLIVITGGEPFRQNIARLCGALAHYGLEVQIESNGMLPMQDEEEMIYRMEAGDVTLVVSPKTAHLDPVAAQYAAAFKYVLTAGDMADDGLPISALGHPLPKNRTVARPPEGFTGVVYVQPADQQNPRLNEANMAAVWASVQMNPSRVVCLQLHKIMGLE